MKLSSFMDIPPAPDAGLFGFEYGCQETKVAIVGVPWEPTVSYRRGTSLAPAAVIPASHQLDLFDAMVGASFGDAVGMLPINPAWQEMNEICQKKADPIIARGGLVDGELKRDLEYINQCSEQLNRELFALVGDLLANGKTVGIMGGDHSCPYGSILAHYDRYPGMGILHIDAHSDLRLAYEGFLFSHASIMYNLIHEIPELNRLISVGIRDYSDEEFRIAKNHPSIRTFYDHDMKRQGFQGRTWADMSNEIIEGLPELVYVSFDIDGLEQRFCPNTGTPVPGGLDFDQAVYLLEHVVRSGRRIVGFDLVEVAPNPNDARDEWDLNVAARLLHKLSSLAYMSQSGKCSY